MPVLRKRISKIHYKKRWRRIYTNPPLAPTLQSVEVVKRENDMVGRTTGMLHSTRVPVGMPRILGNTKSPGRVTTNPVP
jgi:hypothetical protein